MRRSESVEGASNKNKDNLTEKKKRAIAHCLNLECQKEQLSILVDKLNNILNEREDFVSHPQEQGKFTKYVHGIKSNIFSVIEQLKQAKAQQSKLELEINQAKEQINKINKHLKER